MRKNSLKDGVIIDKALVQPVGLLALGPEEEKFIHRFIGSVFWGGLRLREGMNTILGYFR